MSIVIVVGAGATKAEAEKSDPRPAVMPPLDRDFFPICQQTCLSCRGEFEHFAQYVQDAFEMYPLSGQYGMEEVFNLVFADASADQPKPGARAAYWGLVRTYYGIISQTTNDLGNDSDYGVRALLKGILDEDAAGQVSFIAFNQDIMVEKALEAVRAESCSLTWNIKKAYCLEHTLKFGTIEDNPRPFSTSDATSVPVLKLHGSLNWLVPVDDRLSADHWALEVPEDSLYCLNHYKVRTKGFQRAEESFDTVPVVVPPIYDKSGSHAELLKPVWDRAEQELESADRVVVFGYSFPPADTRAEVMFRRSLRRNKQLHEIAVINPDPGVVSKVAALVSGVRLRFCRNVPEFLDSR